MTALQESFAFGRRRFYSVARDLVTFRAGRSNLKLRKYTGNSSIDILRYLNQTYILTSLVYCAIDFLDSFAR